MVYGPAPFRMATSPGLYKWTPVGPMAVKEKSGRDPSLSLIGDIYYLIYCAGNSVKAATSRDLQTWSEPVEIFRPGTVSYQCEKVHPIPYNFCINIRCSCSTKRHAPFKSAAEIG